MSWISPKPGQIIEEQGRFEFMVSGKVPNPGQQVIYVDDRFNLFSSGHIKFFRQVVSVKERGGHLLGWFEEAAFKERILKFRESYGPAYIVAGVMMIKSSITEKDWITVL